MPTSNRLLCRSATTFAEDGSFDEAAFRLFLQRFIDARIGVYLGSAGSGESGSMTLDELARLYAVGVDACQGKVPVHANPPERLSVRETVQHMQIAIDAGVEIVNLYGPAGWHGFKPTEAEFEAFFDDVLGQIHHPVSLSPNPSIGFAPSAAMVAMLCHRHPQVVAVHLVDQPDDYFIRLQDLLKRDVALNVHLTGSMELLLLGADAVIGAELNMIPKTYRKYIDLVAAGSFSEAAVVYADIKRFHQYVARWRGAHPRWIKMMMKVLGIPGSALRGPYQMPGAEETAAFARGLMQLGLAEITASSGEST